MMLRFVYIICLCLISMTIAAQNSLSGTVYDDMDEPLVGATAVLLEVKDSTIIGFSITDGSGSFRFDDLELDQCILQVSYVSFGNYSEVVALDRNMKTEKLIRLLPSSEVLKEVTLKAEHIPMGILGDTINYNAAAFSTKVGDTVEDLLKKMPGIEVARDGSIKAQGEDVENVLVDGREFFGNDPTIATKNLEAEAIDKVQVYDKQSEVAEFTGIDDGQEEKTINLKLKEDYKNGGFGRAELGLANEDRWKSKINYNRFNPKYQASVIGNANNINEQAFSFNEYVSFMGGLSQAMSMSSGVFNFGSFGSPSIPEGVNSDYSGGLNFNIDLSNKLNFMSNYFYLSTRKELDRSTSSVQLRTGGDFETNDTLDLNNKISNHRINTRLEYKHNPLTEIVFKTRLLGVFNDESEHSRSRFRIMDEVLNDNSSNWLFDSEEYGINTELQFNRKFLKKGRSLISSITIDKRKQDALNDIMNTFYLAQDISQLSQNQSFLNDQWSRTARTSYTEPLGNQYYLSLNASFFRDDEEVDKKFYDLVDQLEVLNTDLSRVFSKMYEELDFKISLKRNRRNFKTTIGLARKYLNMNMETLEDDFMYNQDLNFLLPSFIAETELNRNTTINFNYNTDILLPTSSQLMPILDNREATFTTIGNPFLDPEYRHDMSIDLNYFDNFSFTNFFFNIGHSIINDRIVNKIDLNENLTKEISPINSSKFNTSYAFLSFSRPIRRLKTKFRISNQVSRSSYISFLNEVSSEVDDLNVNSRLVFENIKKEKIDIALGLAVDFTDRNYSLSETFSQSFFNQSFFADVSYNISETFILSSTFDLTKYSSEFFSEETSFALWNASVSKLFLDKRLELRLSAFDLLGQNIGINRSGGLSALSESKFNTLESYYMVTIGYRLGQRKKKGALEF